MTEERCANDPVMMAVINIITVNSSHHGIQYVCKLTKKKNYSPQYIRNFPA